MRPFKHREHQAASKKLQTRSDPSAASVGSSPIGVGVTPDGSKAYVVNNASGTVSVINTATNAVVATITVGTDPFGVAITPDGTKAYVTNVGSYKPFASTWLIPPRSLIYRVKRLLTTKSVGSYTWV